MPKLYNVQTGELLGTVSASDVQTLINQLEEEHRTDNDYFINPTTIELLGVAGASHDLVNLLRKAVGNTEGIDVRYEA